MYGRTTNEKPVTDKKRSTSANRARCIKSSTSHIDKQSDILASSIHNYRVPSPLVADSNTGIYII